MLYEIRGNYLIKIAVLKRKVKAIANNEFRLIADPEPVTKDRCHFYRL